MFEKLISHKEKTLQLKSISPQEVGWQEGIRKVRI